MQNPITATKHGQEALQESISRIRDLTKAVNLVCQNIRDGHINLLVNADKGKSFEERVRDFQSKKNTIKQVSVAFDFSFFVLCENLLLI